LRLLDTHAHLALDEFQEDLDAVLTRARKAGLTAVLCVGVDVPSSRRSLALARQWPGFVWAAAGIHPSSCASATGEDFDEIAAMACENEVVAIGETGLDFQRTDAPRERQFEFLTRHIQLARRLDKPLILHSRKADREMLRLLRCEAEGLRGTRHCFDADPETALAWVEVGLHVAFGGLITRPGHERLKEAARQVPAGRILLETDCPYMRPAQVDARRNEPAFVAHVARALAELRAVDAEEAARLTSANAERLLFRR